jgi:cell division protein FtsB
MNYNDRMADIGAMFRHEQAEALAAYNAEFQALKDRYTETKKAIEKLRQERIDALYIECRAKQKSAKSVSSESAQIKQMRSEIKYLEKKARSNEYKGTALSKEFLEEADELREQLKDLVNSTNAT